MATNQDSPPINNVTNGLSDAWESIRRLIDSSGPRRVGEITSAREMLTALRHGNGSWL